MTQIYFSFEQAWWIYALFIVFILVMLAMDLALLQKKNPEQTFKQAISWVVVWVLLAGIFNVLLYYYCLRQMPPAEAKRLALEFLAGYVMEQSLSVDNLFAFVVIFSFFRIPKNLQHRILFFGILGTIVFRGLFVFAGSYLMHYQAVVALFGLFLIFTGVKLLVSADDQKNDLSDEWSFKLARRIFPLTDRLHGASFLVRESGVLKATPLFLCLVIIEMTDLVFAVDSVPAVFGVTREPLIVFTSNMFAILGLRSLYFLLAGLVEVFHFLKYGLGCVLIFVGLKMTAFHWWLPHELSIETSLLVIFVLLAGSILASVLVPHQKPAE